MFFKNDLGLFCNYELHWTPTAKECYKAGCWCSKCPIHDLREQKTKCHMKAVVLELVKKFGVPEECKIFDIKTLITSTEATPTDDISRKRTK